MSTQRNVFAEVKELVLDQRHGIDEARVVLESCLAQDFDFDDLDLHEVRIAVEERFGVDLEGLYSREGADPAIISTMNVKEVVEAVQHLLD